MLDHLVPPPEPVLAASMASSILAVHHCCAFWGMHGDYVSLQVSFPSEGLAIASARLVETVVTWTAGFCSVISAVRSKVVKSYPSLDDEPPSEGGDSFFGC